MVRRDIRSRTAPPLRPCVTIATKLDTFLLNVLKNVENASHQIPGDEAGAVVDPGENLSLMAKETLLKAEAEIRDVLTAGDLVTGLEIVRAEEILSATTVEERVILLGIVLLRRTQTRRATTATELGTLPSTVPLRQ